MTIPPIVTPPPHRFFRPTWVEIDLRALRSNLRRFKARLPRGVKLLFVVKGNAYGHGAAALSKTAEASGAVWGFGVSSVEEGVTLRESGTSLPILVLGSLYPFESFLAAVRYDLTPTVASLEGARKLAEVARALAVSEPSARVRCHLKLDTGMGRIGVGWPSGRGAVDFLAGEPRLHLEGVYTHLACADSDPAFTSLQIRRFKAALADIRAMGVKVPLAHAANSAAALRRPESRFDMVRPGLALYGLYGRDFHPILSLKSRIVFIKNVQKGTPISYGGAYRTRRPARIATLPIGYADGYPRRLGNRAHAVVRGRRCPVIGTVTMDMLMLDVSAVGEAHVGDEAVLIGPGASAGALAKLAGTIPYEIVTQISSRVPRVCVQ